MKEVLFALLFGSAVMTTVGCGGDQSAVVLDVPPMTAEELAAEGEGEEGKE